MLLHSRIQEIRAPAVSEVEFQSWLKRLQRPVVQKHITLKT